MLSNKASARDLATRAIQRLPSQKHLQGNVDIGAYVKRVRADLGLTLQEVSNLSTVSKSTISKIEKGQLSPTFDLLQRLAKGLGLDLAALFSGGVSGSLTRRSVTLRSQGKVVETNEYVYEALATDLRPKRLFPLKATIVARTFEEFGGWIRHDGEELVYVLSGSIKAFTEFYEPVDLEAGDCLYIDSTMGHALISTSSQHAEVFWVCTQISL